MRLIDGAAAWPMAGSAGEGSPSGLWVCAGGIVSGVLSRGGARQRWEGTPAGVHMSCVLTAARHIAGSAKKDFPADRCSCTGGTTSFSLTLVPNKSVYRMRDFTYNSTLKVKFLCDK